MASKATPVHQPCAEVAIQIGQTISAMEAVGRFPWEHQQSCLNTLSQQLGQLQSVYEKTCLDSGPTKPKP